MRTPARRLPGAALLGLAFLWTACSSPAPAPTPAPPPPDAAATEILWDTWGVPHLFAPDDEALFYAHGWAQAHAHGDLLLRLYGESRGRAAEYWGADSLDSDRWVHTVRIPDRAAEWLAVQSPEARAWLDAFTAGINDYAARHPEAIADEVEPVLPVSAVDVLAHVQRAIHFTFLTDPSVVSAAGRHLSAEPRGAERGSNAWAIAPERSASGNALLLANPHLPWADLFTWFEVQMTATGDEGLDVYGAALVGMPFVAIGFNDRLAWTHTVNTIDGFDLYEIELAGDGGGYLWEGAARPFQDRDTVTLRVREEDGTLREETLARKSSVHGPVIAETESGGRAVALRVAGLDRPHLMEQYRTMAGARDLAEFEAALRREQAPMFTVMYADADGRVMHLFDGRVPVLPESPPGAPWDWSGVVPGGGPATLWTEVHPYDALPRVVDPSSGWLQNANDPPWTTTFPPALDPDAYPAGMAPRFMHFRAQRSARMLMEDDSISLDEMIAYKYSTRMELADRVLDDLARAVEEHGDDTARRAMDVLEAWDRTADAGSRGSVLFFRWFDLLRRATDRATDDPAGPFWAEPWSGLAGAEGSERAMATPDGFADPATAAATLSEAARGVREDHGALDVPWGDVYRFRVGGHDLPANGAPGQLGVFPVVYYGGPGGDPPTRRALGGDSFVAAVELSDPVRARTVIPYGNASQPGSPHAGDQLGIYAAKELRPVWRERDEIEEHLERRETLRTTGSRADR